MISRFRGIPKLAVHRYANALLAVAHAKRSAELHLVLQLIFGYKVLKFLNNLP